MNQSTHDFVRGAPNVGQAEVIYKRIGCDYWLGPEKVELEKFAECHLSRAAYREGGPRSGVIRDLMWRPIQG